MTVAVAVVAIFPVLTVLMIALAKTEKVLYRPASPPAGSDLPATAGLPADPGV